MSLLVFFIVFYGQQAYQRYYQYYSHLTGMTTGLMEYMSIVRRHFGENPVGAWNAARCILAAQYHELHTNPRVGDNCTAVHNSNCVVAGCLRLTVHDFGLPFVAATSSSVASMGTTTSRSGMSFATTSC